jgi:hypothetical protein
MNVESALNGRAGEAGVRAVLNGAGRAAVRAALRTMGPAGGRLGPCWLRRGKYKPPRKITASYDVDVTGCLWPVAATWTVPGDGSPHAPGEPGGAAGAAPAAGDHDAPFERLWTAIPEVGLLVQAAPFDPTFPGLAPLADRSQAGCLVAAALPAGASPIHGEVTVRHVRYRPGERHLLEYRWPGGRRVVRAFVKLYRGGRGQDIARVATDLACALERHAPAGLRAARPCGYLPAMDAVVYSPVPGRPLTAFLRQGGLPLGARLRAAGRLLRAIHDLPAGSVPGLASRDLDGEIRGVTRACEHIATLRPDVAACAQRVVERGRAVIESIGVAAPVVTHGDAKADHFIYLDGPVTIIDPDQCALADPALDLGKLMADVRYRAMGAPRLDPAWACHEIVAGYRPDEAVTRRASAYAALLLVKIAARRVPVADPAWGPRTAHLVGLADRGLASGDRP